MAFSRRSPLFVRFFTLVASLLNHFGALFAEKRSRNLEKYFKRAHRFQVQREEKKTKK